MADRQRFQKKIQNVHWTGFNASALALAAAGTAAVTLANAQHLPETILRTRGQSFATIDALSNPGILMRYGIGFAQVPEGTGSTVLWAPLTDSDAPWFWYVTGFVQYEEGVSDATSFEGSFDRQEIDSKAMRIVRQREIQVVFETAAISSTAPMNLAVAGRFLSGS